jgi:hypothetical protein
MYMESAHLITLSVYQATVTPIFKEFAAFIRKNGKYLLSDNYSYLDLITLPVYIERQLESFKINEFYNLGADYAKTTWVKRGGSLEEIPADVHAEYKRLVGLFTGIFGEGNLRLIQKDEAKSNKRAIRRAIDSDAYLPLLMDGVVSPEQLQEIFDATGVKMPKNVLEMKEKVQFEGYDRTAQLMQAKRNSDFAKQIRKAIDSDMEILRERKRRYVRNILTKFEESGSTSYRFAKNFVGQSHKQASMVEQLVLQFFTFDYATKQYNRIETFDLLVESMANQYAEDFIAGFVYRINEKLLVINSNLGTPTINVKHITFGADVEGVIEATWENGYAIEIHPTVILAGGHHIQVLHERYLFKAFHQGKMIKLEEIDLVK